MGHSDFMESAAHIRQGLHIESGRCELIAAAFLTSGLPDPNQEILVDHLAAGCSYHFEDQPEIRFRRT